MPSVTKRHFDRTAKILRDLRRDLVGVASIGTYGALHRIEQRFAAWYASESPAFDRQRFEREARGPDQPIENADSEETFHMQIRMDGDAFSECPVAELSGLLRNAADALDSGMRIILIQDTDGNAVGRAYIDTIPL